MNNFSGALLKYLSKEQIEKIQKIKIGIAGCGGLGSNIANALVRSGFRDFEIIDHDAVEVSNLNRQNFYLDEIGLSKVEATTTRLIKINPDINIAAKKLYLDESNISLQFKDRDIIFEAFDSAESKKLFIETFGNSGKLLILGSGMAGISNKKPIAVRKIKDNIYIVGDEEADIEKGLPPLAPRVIACAAMMAGVALEQVLGQ
ncbi:MAG: sulfur carrier protein ThiS adenylyltransferase ThiF [Candidatus Margulisiibacteriota bacterium]